MIGTSVLPERERWSVSTAAALFAIPTLVFAWAFAAVFRWPGSSDLTVHLDYARELHSRADLTSPHFLFQLLVKAGHAAGLGYENAAVWVLGACYGGLAVLIGYEMHRRGIVVSPIPALVLVMALLSPRTSSCSCSTSTSIAATSCRSRVTTPRSS